MQEWMRKHKRLIQIFILAFIGVPMVIFLGMPSSNRPQESNQDVVIAQVGNVPIMEAEFRQRLDAVAAQRTQPESGRPSYSDLDKDGTAQRVLEQLIDASLVKIQEQQRSFTVDEDFLKKQLQELDWFKDEGGNFNVEAWNEWVSNIKQWDEIYDNLRETVTRQVFLGSVTAPAGRVLQRKINEDLLAEQTKVRVKYAKVELIVNPPEDEIQAHYDENPDMYREPELNQAEFVAISITPEVPELALELVQRARAGEDFAALATEYSDMKQPEGGAMGWRKAGDFVSPHLEPFFDLSKDEVSDPVLGPAGFYIYKVEEERINETTGQVELNGRQIVLNTELDEEALAARKALAEEIAAKMKETDEVAAVAGEYGLEVLRTDFFNRMKLEIENIPYDDLYQFRGQVLGQIDTPWQPIVARRFIYIAKIVDTREGDLPPFEEVRDKVIENIKNERRRMEEYQERLAERIEAIKDRVDNLDAIVSLDSELDVETGETQEVFTRKDSLFQQKIYVQTTDIFNALKEKEVGEVSEPLQGLIGGYWFFQLVERDAPTPEQFAELKKERDEIKSRFAQTAQFEILSDYTKDLRERMLASVSYKQDAAAVDRILGRGLEEGEQAEGETSEPVLNVSADGVTATATIEESDSDTAAVEGEVADASETPEEDAADVGDDMTSDDAADAPADAVTDDASEPESDAPTEE